MAQRATLSINVNATPDTIYSIVTDFAAYGEWVSELKKVEVLERDTAGRALEVEFRAAAFGRSTTYVLRYDYSRAPEQLSWEQVDGDITKSLVGQYKFEPSGSGTKVTYDLEVELAVPIPSIVKARAAQRIQIQALRELRERAERRS